MKRQLSFDGKGINGPDEHRTRLATFANEQAAKEYGPLFEAAPDLLQALQDFVNPWAKGGDWQNKLSYETFNAAHKAIAKAKGGAK